MKVTFASDHPDVWNMYSTLVGHRAFDIGANGGMVSELLAVGFDEVVAFEPCAESAQELRLLQLPNVILNEVAVSDQNGHVTLEESQVSTERFGELVTAHAETELARYWGKKTGERSVPSITLDRCFELYGPADFVKIDTEGHEGHVISGGLAGLKQYHPRLVIEVHRGTLGKAILGQLPEYSFERYDHPIYIQRKSPLVNEHYWLVST